MDILNRALAVILALIALAVLFQFLFRPFYPDSVDVGQVWGALDWPMAFGVIVALIASCVHKRGLESGRSDSRVEHAGVNVVFYAAALLAIWFFWNWFDNLSIGDEVQGQIHLLMWEFIDPLFIIVMGTVSARLWRDTPGSASLSA